MFVIDPSQIPLIIICPPVFAIAPERITGTKSTS